MERVAYNLGKTDEKKNACIFRVSGAKASSTNK